jgi:hypothetical protein
MPGKKDKDDGEADAPDFEELGGGDASDDEDTPSPTSSGPVAWSYTDMLKVMLILFIIIIILDTRFFIDKVLSEIPGAVGDNLIPTSMGTCVRAAAICMLAAGGGTAVRYGLV